MIDSCGLHIGCFLTCTSGVNTLTVELLATVSGTHTIEYHFLDRVIRFEIEATIGQPFEIPTTHFNESGDARIKIILPSGAYFTYTDGTTVYDTFYLTVRQSTDTNLIPPVSSPSVPFATQGYVNTQIAALGIPANYSLSEQVWLLATHFGVPIYWRTWRFTVEAGTTTLTGLSIASVGTIIDHSQLKSYSLLDPTPQVYDPGFSHNVTDYVVVINPGMVFSEITVWYTKP